MSTLHHMEPTPATRPAGPDLPEHVVLDGTPLTVDQVVAVARSGASVEIHETALARMTQSRAVIDGLAQDTVPHYGVSTGFGALARRHIPTEMRAQLQLSLVRSHAAGSGPEVETEVVRALQLLRLATLVTGHTGARPVTAETYAAMLNAGITPVVHEYGSLGCSGDLAPLAHVALAAMGEGRVRVVPTGVSTGSTSAAGEAVDAAQALAEAGIAPLVLAEKEGLALINGTDGMLGMLCLALHDLRSLLTTADVAAALSVEALLGSDAPFAEDLVGMRPHPGQAASASNLRAVLAGSPLMASHRELDDAGNPACTRVQDAYSLRCAPQVHGAARDTLEHAATVAGRELASAIDNPVVTSDGRVESNGNFHGAPIAYVLDFLAIAAADLASMSERRTDRFLDVSRSEGLPAFLAHDPGVDSGHMIAQYTAAGIVSELKRLAAPASVDSIPSSAMQEDHVSMGWSGARKLRRSVDGLTRVLAIEVLTATRALDFRAEAPAAGTSAVHDAVRVVVPGPGPDRYLAPEIEHVVHLVATGAISLAAASAVGPLR
ncbi:histidine ammonia-lyase [Promicromonospora umidemergens]|uniref:Histidine ammonia-lyase n=1 Tax=Promicromonospora umidemergens TaxID=629679 RepID=A0ABP8X6Q4_9MICO|nr:histidine ammonia-lyase [Promicromonospora umidemergens]MCP2281252.1 histidine ammonia-lyase [Promicromonospora umidemergens]